VAAAFSPIHKKKKQKKRVFSAGAPVRSSRKGVEEGRIWGRVLGSAPIVNGFSPHLRARGGRFCDFFLKRRCTVACAQALGGAAHENDLSQQAGVGHEPAHDWAVCRGTIEPTSQGARPTLAGQIEGRGRKGHMCWNQFQADLPQRKSDETTQKKKKRFLQEETEANGVGRGVKPLMDH